MSNIRQQQNTCAIKSQYIVERYSLDSDIAGQSTATIAKHSYEDINGLLINNSLIVGTLGDELDVLPDYRSILIFFKSGSLSGSYMEIDGIVYAADIGVARGDPILSWSAVDENSTFKDELNIKVFDGAKAEVHVQRERI